MHGTAATLKDIDLYPVDETDNTFPCDQQQKDEEGLKAEQGLDVYLVVTECGDCCRMLRVCCESTDEDIRQFEQALCGSLALKCPPCAKASRGRKRCR